MINWFLVSQRKVTALFSSIALVIGLSASPAWAGDPFRESNTRDIGDNTEAAFQSIFKEGDYQEAKLYLQQARSTEASEPLVYAMLASLAYTEKDWDGLNRYAAQTMETAQELTTKDPLRGNLYMAVGHFLEGAYKFEKDGPLSTLSKLQKVFQALEEAEKFDKQDPELNLVKGYMDLMLAVNLPFSDPADAVEKLETYASPSYLAYRGIAVGYRDLKRYTKAMEFVERALELTPNNPEILYLKAQIFVRQDKHEESLEYFKQALAQEAKLPNESVAQIVYEQCKAQENFDSIDRDCRAERNKIRERDS